MLRTTTTAALLLGVALISGCGHGKKLEFNGGEVFYTTNVTEADAQKLGEYLVKEKFFDGTKKSVQLDKKDGVIQFRMVVIDGYMDRKEIYPLAFRAMATELLRDVFNGEKVEVHLCDKHLKTLEVMQPLETPKKSSVPDKSESKSKSAK